MLPVSSTSRCVRTLQANNLFSRHFSTSHQRNDHYKTLGVPYNASKAQIKSHFYQLSKTHHPDVAKDSNSKAIYTAVSEAYSILSNDRERRAYDRSLKGSQSSALATQTPYTRSAPPARARRAGYAWEQHARPRPTPHPRNSYRTHSSPGQHYTGTGASAGAGAHYHNLDPFYRNVAGRRAEEAERELDRVRNESGFLRAVQVMGVMVVCFSILGGFTPGL